MKGEISLDFIDTDLLIEELNKIKDQAGLFYFYIRVTNYIMNLVMFRDYEISEENK